MYKKYLVLGTVDNWRVNVWLPSTGVWSDDISTDSRWRRLLGTLPRGKLPTAHSKVSVFDLRSNRRRANYRCSHTYKLAKSFVAAVVVVVVVVVSFRLAVTLFVPPNVITATVWPGPGGNERFLFFSEMPAYDYRCVGVCTVHVRPPLMGTKNIECHTTQKLTENKKHFIHYDHNKCNNNWLYELF